VWDDWLNREDGKEIRRESIISFHGPRGLIRSYSANQLNVTLPVVCDHCNNTWMSDISNHAKPILEPSIRRDEAMTYDELDVITLSSFVFLKAAVLDWSIAPGLSRRPYIPRAACLRFRDSLFTTAASVIAFPPHLQIWVAQYRRTRAMEALALIDKLTGVGRLKGLRILLITYVVGSFVFQLTCPRRSKEKHDEPGAPLFDATSDRRAVAIWPNTGTAYWPPTLHLDSSTLESFRERFRTVNILGRQ